MAMEGGFPKVRVIINKSKTTNKSQQVATLATVPDSVAIREMVKVFY